MMSIIIDIYRQTPQPSPWSLQFRGPEVWLLSAVRVLRLGRMSGLNDLTTRFRARFSSASWVKSNLGVAPNAPAIICVTIDMN